MSQNIFLNSSDVPPPQLPPVAKGIVFVFTILITLALLAFIGFIAVEFTAEIVGHPLNFGRSVPMEGALPTEQERERALKGPFELMTPKDQSQIWGPEVVVIYTVRKTPTVVPDLWINDVQYPWEVQYGENTWFARLQLPAGRYHLQAGEAVADFVVETPNSVQRAPGHWLLNIPHIGANEVDKCNKCHEMTESSISLSMPGQDRAIDTWKGALGCFACHDAEKHATDHRFVLPSTDRDLRCIRCHTIH